MPEPSYRVVSALAPGTALARFIRAKAVGRGDHYRELMIAEAWRDTPHVLETLKLSQKTATPAGSTSDAGWAGPLAAYGIAAEALTLLRGMSIVGKLEPQLRKTPLHVKVARETGAGITGGWVAEGAPIPVQKTAFDTVSQEHYKFGVIIPVSEELVELSSPDAEATLRTAVLGGLAAALDNQFLLASVTASAGVNPASIANAATEVTSTGGTSAQITADLTAMLAAVTTPGPLTWVLRPTTMYKIALTLGHQASGLPATLFGIPVISSVTAPAQITLVDPSAILYSDSGQFEVDVSTHASVQLDTAPADPTVASTIFATAWGRNLVFIRVLRWLAWQRVRDGGVAFMTVAY